MDIRATCQDWLATAYLPDVHRLGFHLAMHLWGAVAPVMTALP
jgi:hypothetical protein